MQNKLITLCLLCIALCGACQQDANDSHGGTANSTPSVSAPGMTTTPTGMNAAPGAVAPGIDTAGSAAPGNGTPSASGDVAPTTGEKLPVGTQQAPRYPGLQTGPDIPIDPATQVTRFVPTDERAAKQALQATPISGGTLLITTDGATAVASDPERDRVSIVDLATTWLLGTVALQAGDEPGRMVQDPSGKVHVVLRRAGAVATIDLLTHAVTARRAVCTAPRGIAYDASSQMLKVACVGGELVDLPAGSGEVAARVQVDSDLRDVVETKSGAFVTRLKSAELLHVDSAGKTLATTRATTPTFLFSDSDGALVVDSVEPVGARRTVAALDGGLIMLHQGERNGDIEVKNDNPNGGASPYGGAGSCGGVVMTEVTHFDASGKPLNTIQIPGVLAVDIAESPKQDEFAIAFAGAGDPLQPVSQLLAPGQAPPDPASLLPSPDVSADVLTVMMFQRDASLNTAMNEGQPSCIGQLQNVFLPSPATALAYAGDKLVIQTREPAALYIVDAALAGQTNTRAQVDLGGPSMFDTGHEIFHRDAGAGVACASCHIEGGDDGHVWHFLDQGERRTQSMFVGLQGTAPFHWVGDMNDLGTLMENVFVGRMGGVHQSTARLGGLEQWLYAIKTPPALRSASDPAAVRGKALFEGDAKCTKCHNGAKLTNNHNEDVGTGLTLQVPSLVGVGYRGPWMHSGCAATLRDRFDPACGGGDHHGQTSQLSEEQIGDLVAYLETL